MGASMAVLGFNYRSLRAQKARLAVKLSHGVRAVIGLAGILLAAGGVLVVWYLQNSFGWVLLGLVALPVMLLYWYKNDLRRLDVTDDGSIDGQISGSVLGILPEKPKPQDVAQAIGKVSSGRFLALRFAIGPQFLTEIANSAGVGIDVVWENAVEIRRELQTPVISSGVLALAIIKIYPDYEGLLARLQLSYEDLVDGVRWHDHVYYMAQKLRVPMRTGGIARDWSFGFTPMLNKFARNISQEISYKGGRTMSLAIESHVEIVDRMVDVFSKGGRQNLAIVGPNGAGKTSVVHDFAEKLLDAGSKIPQNLKFRQIFLLDSASLIAAAPGKGELENLVTQLLLEAYSAKNIIICLDDAQLFFEEGTGSVDIGNILLPILEAGNLRMILTMNEQKLLEIGQKNPALINALNRINIAPANYRETIAAMEDMVIQYESSHSVVYMYQSLKTAYSLSERYIYDLAMPGRAIKLLETAASYAQDGFVTAMSVEKAVEMTLGVKVGTANVDSEKEKLLNLEELIHQRMINQNRAVQVVSDALRRARTGVRNEKRPIGTFLFLGPTGVGKTELAKALADVYFGGEENLVRVDLNQYVTVENVADLTADGADNPNSLTAQVMKYPFSVVLLDEIEKAHPNVLTALLQVLDEGVLRDARGREVSFRDTIVIATSNAGADKIREYIGGGLDLDQVEDKFVNELIDSNQFRPEFLNRFDEIVLFKPLSKKDLLAVVGLIIDGVNKTLLSQKITVEVEDGAKELLVEAGYDPRLGARPMRRVVQRVVENQVAKKMLSGEATAGSKILITEEQVRVVLGQSSSGG